MSNATPTFVIAGGDDDGARVTAPPLNPAVVGGGGGVSVNGHGGGGGGAAHHAGTELGGRSSSSGGGTGGGGYIRAESMPPPVANGGIVRYPSSSGGGGSSKSPMAAARLLLPTPGAPVGGGGVGGGAGGASSASTLSSSRRDAYTAAVFYGECHLAGVTADDAHDAATDVKEKHRRWWVDALHDQRQNRSQRRSSSGAMADDSSNNSSLGDGGGPLSPRFGRTDSSSSGRRGVKKPRHYPSRRLSDEERAEERARERRGGGGVRDVIKRVNARQEEQGGGYISPVTVVSPSSGTDPTTTEDESGNDTDANTNTDTTGGRKMPPQHSSLTRREESNDKDHNHRGGRDYGVSSLSLAPTISPTAQQRAARAKSALLSSLASSGGDMTTPTFRSALTVLESYFVSTGRDARRSAFANSSRLSHGGSTEHSTQSAAAAAEGVNLSMPPPPSSSRVPYRPEPDLEGTWLSLSRPDYNGCLGTNDRSHYLYSLGRMSFDMFRPTHLRCSIQGEFNVVRVVDGEMDGMPEFVPRRLRREVLRCRHNGGRLRTYNIVVAFVIEPNQNRRGEENIPEQKTKQGGKKNAKGRKAKEEHNGHVITRPIRGIMTNLGYMLPDPKVPNRMSIWFTEGTLEVNDEDADLDEWKQIFDVHGAPKRDLRERAHVLAAKVLLGAHVPDAMEDDGTLSYSLTRPIGGHGLAFCDVLYLDEDLRIIRGHHGQLFVSARVLTKGQSAAAMSLDADLVGGGHANISNGDPSKGSPFQVSA